MSDWSGRTLVAGGASQGLGRGIARAAATAGAPVVAVARTGQASAELATTSANIRTEVVDAADAMVAWSLLDQDEQAEFADPIAVEAGEAFVVSQRTSAWENNPAWMWVWCTDQRGKSGWVPKTIIQFDADGQTGTTHAAYNARELTVAADQELTIEQEESGWFWCRDQQGKRGWVPLSHIKVE